MRFMVLVRADENSEAGVMPTTTGLLAAMGKQIELRQVFEAEDFGPDFTCEVREKEEHMRAEVATRH